MGYHFLPEGHCGNRECSTAGVAVPIYDRFFVGGIDTVRGFEYGEAGPLDPITGDTIGASNELYFNSEWIFNIFKPAGLKGDIFFDYGKGFNSMNGFFEPLRPAAGFGIRWYSPMGPIRVELGFNLNRKTGEKGSRLRFFNGKTILTGGTMKRSAVALAALVTVIVFLPFQVRGQTALR